VWAWRINCKGWKLTFPHCGSIISYLQKTKTALCLYMCIYSLHTKNLINSESVILFLFVFFPCLTPWLGWNHFSLSQNNWTQTFITYNTNRNLSGKPNTHRWDNHPTEYHDDDARFRV
jgi:hypothetical protein